MTKIPDTAIAAVRALCDARLPHADRSEVRLDVEVEESAISIIERHAPFMGVGEWTATSLAQLRLEDDGSWTMYTTDDDDQWELFFDLADHQPLEVLLEELTEDPSSYFWG
jgi:hypothetical protein